jgi:hypothetical protein
VFLLWSLSSLCCCLFVCRLLGACGCIAPRSPNSVLLRVRGKPLYVLTKLFVVRKTTDLCHASPNAILSKKRCSSGSTSGRVNVRWLYILGNIVRILSVWSLYRQYLLYYYDLVLLPQTYRKFCVFLLECVSMLNIEVAIFLAHRDLTKTNNRLPCPCSAVLSIVPFLIA